MQWFDLTGQKFENDEHVDIPEPEEVEVLPLKRVPVSYEVDEERIHDGINPCGRYGCPCMTYGYGVPSLD